MTSDIDHVLESIDGALADYSSNDGARWSGERLDTPAAMNESSTDERPPWDELRDLLEWWSSEVFRGPFDALTRADVARRNELAEGVMSALRFGDLPRLAHSMASGANAWTLLRHLYGQTHEDMDEQTRDAMRYAQSGHLFGIPIVLDDALDDDLIELRDRAGRLVGRVNVASPDVPSVECYRPQFPTRDVHGRAVPVPVGYRLIEDSHRCRGTLGGFDLSSINYGGMT